ncbi:MAG: hypothetical protein ACJ8GW_20695 [Massilia sp.]
MQYQLSAVLAACALLAGCGTSTIQPSQLTPSTRDECLVVTQDLSYTTTTMVKSIHTIKPGIYRAVVDNKTGTFFAREGFPISSRAKNSDPGDPVYWYGGGVYLPYGAPEGLKLFMYESMMVAQHRGKLVNLGDPSKLPVGAENVDFQNGPWGVLGNAVAGGLVSAMRGPEGTIVLWSFENEPAFRQAVLASKASGKACTPPAASDETPKNDGV